MTELISEWPKILTTAIVTGVVTASMTFLATYMALFRYRSEKLLDKKISAYDEAVAALTEIYSYYEAHGSAIEDGRLLSQQREDEFASSIKAAYKRLFYLRSSGSLWLSSKAMKCLSDYELANKGIIFENHYQKEMLEHNAAISKCLTEFIQIARRDIKKLKV